MGALDEIQERIAGFSGYETDEKRRMADEQIRAYVGERLAELPASDLETLPPEARAVYDRLLLRCEFMNQLAFRQFEDAPVSAKVEALAQADAALVQSAGNIGGAAAGLSDTLRALDAAYDRRDAAMVSE